MSDYSDLFIDGTWAPSISSTRLQVVNPATEEAWAQVPDGGAADIDAAVSAARGALPGWAATPPGERAAAIERLAAEVAARAGAFTGIITAENGTPVAESSIAAKVGAAHLRHIAGLAELIIKLGPALLAGGTTVLKPAPQTPMAGRLLMDAVAAAGLPPGVVNLVTGGTEAGAALVSHPDVGKISFTGSTAAGRAIAAACGQLLRPVTLELGGKSPAIVLDDVDTGVLELLGLVADVVAAAPLGDPEDPATLYLDPSTALRRPA